MVFDTLTAIVWVHSVRLGHENLDLTQLSSVGGIATDSQGNVYVADADAGRILRFAPFEPPVVQPPADQSESEVRGRWVERNRRLSLSRLWEQK